MKKLLSSLTAVIYLFLSLFGLTFGDGTRIFAAGTAFTVEEKSDIFIPSENVWNNGADYPDIIRLRDGTLLASFEVFDKGQTGFRIMASTDRGKSWHQRSFVAETADDSLNAAWNPCLIELEEPAGGLAGGTVLLAGVSIDPTQSVKSRISVFASVDSAKSWTELPPVDEAGGIGDGVWEPELAFEDGYIYCFYSDDADTGHSQTIVYRRTGDGVNWSEKTPVVVSAAAGDRPGMPVLTRMGGSGWFLCYEFGRGGEYPVYCKASASLSEWNAADPGVPVTAKGGRSKGSAPGCVWLPSGSGKGTLIVSAKYDTGGKNDLFVSKNGGKTFKPMINPLDYSDLPGFGYHASFFWSDEDNALYYANAVDYNESLSKISFARLSPGLKF